MAAICQDYLRRLKSVAQHELGHYVASRHFGFRTGSVSIQVDVDGSGHHGRSKVALHLPIDSIDALDKYLIRRCVILYAGAMAEVLFAGSPDKRVDDDDYDRAVEILEGPNSGAYVDEAKAYELRALLRNIRHVGTPPSNKQEIASELRKIRSEIWEITIAVIDQYYETICGLASDLSNRLVTEGEEIVISPEELEALPAIAAIVPVD